MQDKDFSVEEINTIIKELNEFIKE